MADTHPISNDDDLDDDNESEPLNDVVPNPEDSSDSDTDDADTNSTSSPAAVTLAIPIATAITAATTPEAKRQRFDDSRRLFQRLWTDEDEIELLQGFLDYTMQRGTTSSGYQDTTAFYDQIKSKLQLDFNKNQLVEKLRRLKKKYRNVVSKMSSGKDFVFKSSHDQITFEISRKIWSNSVVNRPEFDEDEQQNPNSNPNPNPNLNLPPHIINLNSSNYKPGGVANLDINSAEGVVKSRKRSRGKMEEKLGKNLSVTGNEGGAMAVPAVNASSSIPGLIEESVKNSLTPLLKEFMNNAVKRNGIGGDGKGIKGIESLLTNAIPLNFTGLNLGSRGEVMDEKWRTQQILELEVYSKRLELVQDQIKSMLEELKSMN